MYSLNMMNVLGCTFYNMYLTAFIFYICTCSLDKKLIKKLFDHLCPESTSFVVIKKSKESKFCTERK